MCKKIRIVTDVIPSVELQLQVDYLRKVTEAIEEYARLIMPPKVLGGFCPCLKPARNGPEYERTFFVVLSKIVSALFLSEILLIEYQVMRINNDSTRFIDYTNRMDALQSVLKFITTNNDDVSRENCRVELMTSAEQIIKFMDFFEDDVQEIKAQSDLKLASILDLLSPKNSQNSLISTRMLMKILSILQEIMNFIGVISMNKSIDTILIVFNLEMEQIQIWQAQKSSFLLMENKSKYSDKLVLDILNKLIRENESINNDATLHLKAASER